MSAVLCFGDSLTAGYWAGGHEFYPYANTLRQLLGDSVLVDFVGLSGWTTTQMVESLDSTECVDVCQRSWKGLRAKLGERAFSHCVILAGTNDLSRCTACEIMQNVVALSRAASASFCKPFVMTVPELAVEKDFHSIAATRSDLNRLLLQADGASLSNGQTLSTIDLAPLLPMQNTKRAQAVWEPDGLHLRPAGYDIIADTVAKALRLGDAPVPAFGAEETGARAPQGATEAAKANASQLLELDTMSMNKRDGTRAQLQPHLQEPICASSSSQRTARSGGAVSERRERAKAFRTRVMPSTPLDQAATVRSGRSPPSMTRVSPGLDDPARAHRVSPVLCLSPSCAFGAADSLRTSCLGAERQDFGSMHRIMGAQTASSARSAGTLGLAHGEECGAWPSQAGVTIVSIPHGAGASEYRSPLSRLSLSDLPRPTQVRQRIVRDVAERMLLTDSRDDAIRAVLPTRLHDTARACSHFDAVAATQCEPSVAHAAPAMPHGRVAAGSTTTVPCYKRACPPRIAFA